MVIFYSTLIFETHFLLFLEKHNIFLELEAGSYFLLVLTKSAPHNGAYSALQNIFVMNTVMKPLVFLKKIL